MSDSRFVLRRIVQGLPQFGFMFRDEKQLHDGIAEALRSLGIEFQHELTVGDDRFDFYCPNGSIVIEAKIKGSMSEASRQADRYLQQDCVQGVIVATTCTWGRTVRLKRDPMGFAWMRDKPVDIVYLQRQRF